MTDYLIACVESEVNSYDKWSIDVSREDFIEFIQDNFKICFDRLSDVLRVDYPVHEEISEKRANFFVKSIVSNIYMYEIHKSEIQTDTGRKLYKRIIKSYRDDLRNKENSYKRTVLKLMKKGDIKTAQKLATLTARDRDKEIILSRDNKDLLLELLVNPKAYMILPTYRSEYHVSKENVKRNILSSLHRLDVSCKNQLDKITLKLPIT